MPITRNLTAYRHIYRHRTGENVVVLLSPWEEPTVLFREAMANQWYEFVDSEPNI